MRPVSIDDIEERIVALATRHHVPAIYPFRYFAASGGLMSYGNELPPTLLARSDEMIE